VVAQMTEHPVRFREEDRQEGHATERSQNQGLEM
jgi:hypothetical protein